MRIDLTGNTILVTGASRGIGRAIATELAQAGGRVALHYHHHQQAARTLAIRLGGEARAFQADLADPEACGRLWEEVTREFGGVDVLINNAGIAIESPLADSEASWLASWEATQRVNLTAAAQLSRRALLHFQEGGGGRIIFIASRAAFRGDTPEYLAYAASKGGMVALARSIARGYGRAGVKAFVVAPGFVRTDMAQDFIDRYGEGIARDDLALSEPTRPEHVAPLVALLASGLADHATGGTFDVNAGSYVH